ncbi:glycosyltransferase family 2 protein [Leptothermofonsia sp. ETS-13]|uniref:glycosyltransferase family 2 protein n=1 Tax=Leptothermofonsia sp. ETS-13 TaxID=3035696 RepID=UPI003B9FFC6C
MNCDRTPLVSIILVNYNGMDVIENCLRSLQQFFQAIPYEAIVVDNASQDGSPDLVEQTFPQVYLIRLMENRGFGAGNNIGAKTANGEFLFFLNTDTQLTSDILPTLVTLMKEHPDVGIIGPKLLNPDGSLQLSTAWSISITGEFKTLQQLKDYESSYHQAAIARRFDQTHEVDVVVGAAFLIRKTLFETLGGFDESFFMYFEESDLCQRAQYLGWKILYTPAVSLIHIRGHSTDKIAGQMAIEYRRSQLYYYQKHRPLWEQVVLRLYLLFKFAIATLRSTNPIYRTLIRLLLDFKQYPLKPPQHGKRSPIVNTFR